MWKLLVLTILCFSLITESYTYSDIDDITQFLYDSWGYLKRQHLGRQVNEASQTRLLNTDMDYFKNIILNPMLIERVSGTEGNRQIQQHIKNLMSTLGWHIKEDRFTDNTPHGEKEFTNIIAVQDQYAPRTLTLACHFDSKYYQNIVFIGATDSAVPCAMLIDIATALNQSLWRPNKSPQVSLQFIFFDGEEAFVRWTSTDSIYGSRHLANRMHTEKREVLREVIVSELETMDMLVLLDLIGARDPRFLNYFESTSKHYKSLKDIESRLAERGLLSYGRRSGNVYFPSANLQRSGIEDDHIPFLRKNVPILHLISYPFPNVWHTERDNESALDYDTIDDLNKILRVFVAEYLHLNP